ncbi:MAG: hypothetical protein LBH31_03180 [Burkholderiaceae bacterium]|jgi:hypothetical protein|nr:hypothetical protein [Burkholderiaceae bacterium]
MPVCQQSSSACYKAGGWEDQIRNPLIQKRAQTNVSSKLDSVEPTLYDDKLVVVNPADTTGRGGKIFAINNEGKPVVKTPDPRRGPVVDAAGQPGSTALHAQGMRRELHHRGPDRTSAERLDLA